MTLFPYVTLQADVAVALNEVSVDGRRPAVDVILPTSKSVDLSILPRQDWTVAEFELSVSAPVDDVRALETRSGSAEVSVIATCGPTNMRQATRLARSTSDAGRWSGNLLLDRRNYAGKVLLYAVVAGEALGRAHRFMAKSVPWSIYVDEPAIPLIEGTMRVKWADFTSTEAEPAVLGQYQDEVYYADLQDLSPTLYLNSSFKGLPELLADRRGRPPAEEALHQSERMSIASAVWLAMFNASVAAIQIDEEDTTYDWPLTEWQKSVLQTLLPRVYADASETERLQLSHEAWDSAEGAMVLESTVQMEIARHIGSATALRRSLDRLQRVEDSGE